MHMVMSYFIFWIRKRRVASHSRPIGKLATAACAVEFYILGVLDSTIILSIADEVFRN